MQVEEALVGVLPWELQWEWPLLVVLEQQVKLMERVPEVAEHRAHLEVVEEGQLAQEAALPEQLIAEAAEVLVSVALHNLELVEEAPAAQFGR